MEVVHFLSHFLVIFFLLAVKLLGLKIRQEPACTGILLPNNQVGKILNLQMTQPLLTLTTQFLLCLGTSLDSN